jgi:alcohol dehydrogenase (cytochrome c)
MRASILILAAALLPAQVPYERILKADGEPGNWLTYSRTFDGQRYSPLSSIHRGNVARLKPAWIYQSWTSESRTRWETSPLAVDGILYVTEQPSDAAALDARTGRPYWKYRREVPTSVQACCGRVNRGMAILGDTLYLGTLDGFLVALDRVTGRVRWSSQVTDMRQSYSITVAPLAVKDKVVIGVSGGEFGIRGLLDAYDAKTGKRAWRFWTVPGPGEPGNETWAGDSWKTGAAGTWATGSFDPETNLVFWGTGNPGPDYDGAARLGDNLYACSLLAIDADSGKLKWHFQFTPHDVHDWDSNHVPVLAEIEIGGRRRKVVMVANRNGFFYVLDRATGEFLLGKPFARQTWARGLDARGRPITIAGTEASTQGPVVYPGLHGGTNWFSPSFSPRTGLFYVSTRDEGTRFYIAPAPYRPGATFTGGGPAGIPGEEPTGWVQAIAPSTGEQKWKFNMPTPPWAGLLSSAGGLVFGGSNEGTFFALNDETGEPLWHFQTGGWINANPMSFSHQGKQYVVVPSGRALIAFAVD